MTWFHATMVALLLSLPVQADEAANHAQSKDEVERKVAEVERLGATLKPGDSKERVEEVMGSPTTIAAGYWKARSKPVEPFWLYEFWPTKDHLIKISALFDTSYRFKKLEREDARAEKYTKLPLVEVKGIVENVFSPEGSKHLLCQIKIPNSMPATYPVSNSRVEKVRGVPKVGSTIIVQTYGIVSPHCFVFEGEWILRLHLITFKDAPAAK